MAQAESVMVGLPEDPEWLGPGAGRPEAQLAGEIPGLDGQH